jgi:hypothetical protein
LLDGPRCLGWRPAIEPQPAGEVHGSQPSQFLGDHVCTSIERLDAGPCKSLFRGVNLPLAALRRRVDSLLSVSNGRDRIEEALQGFHRSASGRANADRFEADAAASRLRPSVERGDVWPRAFATAGKALRSLSERKSLFQGNVDHRFLACCFLSESDYTQGYGFR